MRRIRKIPKKPYRCTRCGSTTYRGKKYRKCIPCTAAYDAKYVSEHREKYAEYSRNKHKRDVEAGKIRRHNPTSAMFIGDANHAKKRRDAMKQGTLTLQELKDVVARDEGKCVYCRDAVKTTISVIYLKGFDHFIPLLSRDGGHHGWNLGVCCPSCNAEKWNMTLDEYIEHKEFDYNRFKHLPRQAFGEIMLD